ncbi:hypothetical protein C2G38_2098934 [Gigaspora rosea]|uniref:Uncharacterized protein n=2 Tax=Gigaspora rosea TaxID=44941 RepID=A0A397UWR9_9GLOM|nr:hypothetical protein C2G38_2098934 [Gigaspora rosea]
MLLIMFIIIVVLTIINNSLMNSLRLKENMILYQLFDPMKLHNNGLFGSEFLYKSWSLKRNGASIMCVVYMRHLVKVS